MRLQGVQKQTEIMKYGKAILNVQVEVDAELIVVNFTGANDNGKSRFPCPLPHAGTNNSPITLRRPLNSAVASHTQYKT